VSAGVLNLKCEQGASFFRIITVSSGTPAVPMDLTGYTVRAEIRRSANDASSLQAFTCSLLDASQGKISLSLSADQTSALATRGIRYSEPTTLAYDLKIQAPDGTVIRLLNGDFQVSPQVTR
jgi:hypothetical protein